MPPKVKFTKEQVIKAGLEIVRTDGEEGISARAIGKILGSSSQPLFSYFETMEDLKKGVFDEAKKLYSEYISAGLSENLPFKAAGMKHIKFANDEPALFGYLFMTDRGEKTVPHFLFKNGINYEKVLASLEKSWNLEKEMAEKIYNHISVYTHGLAILFAQKTNIYTLEEAEEMISHVFKALMREERGELYGKTAKNYKN